MTDWTSGYVADIGYTYGYYNELNPQRLKLAFINKGLKFPEVHTACELGFGQGVSVNLHAAASSTQWYGTDFNPSQAACAREFAQISGTNAKLFDDSFADFAKRDDLPEFDFISLHGIWSWISDENRHIIVDLIQKKLKVGGVVYVSYNTLPGWAQFAPMRHLMTLHAEIIGSEGRGIVSRIDDAIDFAEKLVATNPIFARANPLVAERLGKLKEQNRHYLAHEYFNRDWHPMHFGHMAEWMESAKLSYACSANYLDHIDSINMTAEQQAFLNEISDPVFRESVRDFMTNQQFRRDYWVKGPRRITDLEQAEMLRDQTLLLTTPLVDVTLKVNGSLGEATMSEDVYKPILEILADHKPRKFSELEQLVKPHGVSLPNLVQAIFVLTGGGHLASVQDGIQSKEMKQQTDRINRHIISSARSRTDISCLASTVLGGGFAINRVQQIFVGSILNGKQKPEDWASDTWSVLNAQGQKIVKDGKALATDKENLDELTMQANVFAEHRVPILKALKII